MKTYYIDIKIDYFHIFIASIISWIQLIFCFFFHFFETNQKFFIDTPKKSATLLFYHFYYDTFF
jgi:hypothetical protein